MTVCDMGNGLEFIILKKNFAIKIMISLIIMRKV